MPFAISDVRNLSPPVGGNKIFLFLFTWAIINDQVLVHVWEFSGDPHRIFVNKHSSSLYALTCEDPILVSLVSRSWLGKSPGEERNSRRVRVYVVRAEGDCGLDEHEWCNERGTPVLHRRPWRNRLTTPTGLNTRRRMARQWHAKKKERLQDMIDRDNGLHIKGNFSRVGATV